MTEEERRRKGKGEEEKLGKKRSKNKCSAWDK